MLDRLEDNFFITRVHYNIPDQLKKDFNIPALSTSYDYTYAKPPTGSSPDEMDSQTSHKPKSNPPSVAKSWLPSRKVNPSNQYKTGSNSATLFQNMAQINAPIV